MDKGNIRLKQYSPNDIIWDNIENELDNREKLLRLKYHNPKGAIWETIEGQLENKTTIPCLPRYEPNERLWESIERQLKGKKSILFYNWSKIAAVAIIFCALSYVLNLLLENNVETRTYSYSEEWVVPIDINAWGLEEDGDVTGLLANRENQNPSLLESTDYLELKDEFQNLLSSKQEILNQVNAYEDDSELESILIRIELEKNAIVRSLMFFNLT